MQLLSICVLIGVLSSAAALPQTSSIRVDTDARAVRTAPEPVPSTSKSRVWGRRRKALEGAELQEMRSGRRSNIATLQDIADREAEETTLKRLKRNIDRHRYPRTPMYSDHQAQFDTFNQQNYDPNLHVRQYRSPEQDSPQFSENRFFNNRDDSGPNHFRAPRDNFEHFERNIEFHERPVFPVSGEHFQPINNQNTENEEERLHRERAATFGAFNGRSHFNSYYPPGSIGGGFIYPLPHHAHMKPKLALPGIGQFGRNTEGMFGQQQFNQHFPQEFRPPQQHGFPQFMPPQQHGFPHQLGLLQPQRPNHLFQGRSNGEDKPDCSDGQFQMRAPEDGDRRPDLNIEKDTQPRYDGGERDRPIKLECVDKTGDYGPAQNSQDMGQSRSALGQSDDDGSDVGTFVNGMFLPTPSSARAKSSNIAVALPTKDVEFTQGQWVSKDTSLQGNDGTRTLMGTDGEKARNDEGGEPVIDENVQLETQTSTLADDLGQYVTERKKLLDSVIDKIQSNAHPSITARVNTLADRMRSSNGATLRNPGTPVLDLPARIKDAADNLISQAQINRGSLMNIGQPMLNGMPSMRADMNDNIPDMQINAQPASLNLPNLIVNPLQKLNDNLRMAHDIAKARLAAITNPTNMNRPAFNPEGRADANSNPIEPGKSDHPVNIHIAALHLNANPLDQATNMNTVNTQAANIGMEDIARAAQEDAMDSLAQQVIDKVKSGLNGMGTDIAGAALNTFDAMQQNRISPMDSNRDLVGNLGGDVNIDMPGMSSTDGLLRSDGPSTGLTNADTTGTTLTKNTKLTSQSSILPKQAQTKGKLDGKISTSSLKDSTTGQAGLLTDPTSQGTDTTSVFTQKHKSRNDNNDDQTESSDLSSSTESSSDSSTDIDSTTRAKFNEKSVEPEEENECQKYIKEIVEKELENHQRKDKNVGMIMDDKFREQLMNRIHKQVEQDRKRMNAESKADPSSRAAKQLTCDDSDMKLEIVRQILKMLSEWIEPDDNNIVSGR